VLGAPDDTRVMQEEIFGPLLPLVPYDDLAGAIAYVNARPRPLALYVFDRDDTQVQRVLRETTSGGAAVNETMLHVGQDELPFGGVGPSGMGRYHGREGFDAFSNRKGVFMQARLNSVALLDPPWRGARGGRVARLLDLMIGR
jgi:coniferyl-aldehyde dehydrogenase